MNRRPSLKEAEEVIRLRLTSTLLRDLKHPTRLDGYGIRRSRLISAVQAELRRRELLIWTTERECPTFR